MKPSLPEEEFTCKAERSSLRSSWRRPSPACRDRRPWPDTSCAACRRWCRQKELPSSPGWAHTSPAAHWEVQQSQGTTQRTERRQTRQESLRSSSIKRPKQREEDIFVVFGSSELFYHILGVTNHVADFFWFWWSAQLPNLHFCLVLQRRKKIKKIHAHIKEEESLMRNF